MYIHYSIQALAWYSGYTVSITVTAVQYIIPG